MNDTMHTCVSVCVVCTILTRGNSEEYLNDNCLNLNCTLYCNILI